MALKNGRATYNELREAFDRVIIRHDLNEDGTARTTCLLVRDNNIFVGVSKFSNRTFNFSKKKGRAIAQGRAELANAVHDGKATVRVSQLKRREQLSYTITPTDGTTVQDVIDGFFKSQQVAPLAVEEIV